jgi:hypothetical protein
MMERVYFKTKKFDEAEKQDILQYVRLTPDERQRIARELKERVYGKNVQDVREKRLVRKKA